MHKPTLARIVAALFLFLVVLLIAAWTSGFQETMCEQTKSGEEQCAPYNLAAYYLVRTRRTIDENDGLITALATIVIAAFTGTLWQSTRNLWLAGERQMSLIEGNAKKELRAYLTVVPDGINQLIGESNVMGHVVLKNVGRLPARNVTLLVSMELSDGPEMDSFFRRQVFNIAKVATNSDRVIQPGGEMRQGSERPTLAISELCVPDHNVYVYGIVRYDNGYGEQCFTKFCHRYATASRDRSVKPDSRPNKSRAFIGADKARYHNYGNSAEILVGE